MDYLAPTLLSGQRPSVELIAAATREPEDESEKDSPEPSIFKAVELLTKGMEIPLPNGYSFRDKYEIERSRVPNTGFEVVERLLLIRISLLVMPRRMPLSLLLLLLNKDQRNLPES